MDAAKIDKFSDKNWICKSIGGWTGEILIRLLAAVTMGISAFVIKPFLRYVEGIKQVFVNKFVPLKSKIFQTRRSFFIRNVVVYGKLEAGNEFLDWYEMRYTIAAMG